MRVDAAPAPLLQLHLGVEVLLVLLHDVGEVGAPAALCVVLLAVAVVMLLLQVVMVVVRVRVVVGGVLVVLWDSSHLWLFHAQGEGQGHFYL